MLALKVRIDEVAEALGEQYLPKFPGDVLPQTKTGTTIALADRFDHACWYFWYWSSANRF